MGARSHGQGRVCGRHRDHTFCPPADFLGGRRRDLQHLPDGPSLEGELMLSGMRDVVIRVPAPRVARTFDVERGAGLADRLYR